MKKAGKFKVYHSWTITEMDGNFHRITCRFRREQGEKIKKPVQKVWWLIWDDMHCNRLAIPIVPWHLYIMDLTGSDWDIPNFLPEKRIWWSTLKLCQNFASGWNQKFSWCSQSFWSKFSFKAIKSNHYGILEGYHATLSGAK